MHKKDRMEFNSTDKSFTTQVEGAAMYVKFPFYSIALMFAFSKNTPLSIMIGNDNYYWVVDRHITWVFEKNGGVLLNSMN